MSTASTDTIASAAGAARAAGYGSARDFNESSAMLDRLCERHGITPMQIGVLRFYPTEDMRRCITSKREVPEGMVPLKEWTASSGVSYNTFRRMAARGKYAGRHGSYCPSGSHKKASLHIYPDEAAAFFGLDKVEGKTWRGLSAAAKLSSIPKAELRELVERDEIEGRRHEGKLQIEESSLRAYLAEPAGVRARPATPEQHASHATIREAVAEIERRVAARIDEGVAAIVREFRAHDARILGQGGSVDSLIRLSKKVEQLGEQFDRVRAIVAGRAGEPQT